MFSNFIKGVRSKKGESLPLAPTEVISPSSTTPFSATPSTGDGSGIAFTETRSKPVSQVLPANAVAPYPQRPPMIAARIQFCYAKSKGKNRDSVEISNLNEYDNKCVRCDIYKFLPFKNNLIE